MILGTLQALREHMRYHKERQAWVFAFDTGALEVITISLKPHEYDMALILEVFKDDKLVFGPIPLKALIGPQGRKATDRSLIGGK